MIDGRGTAEQAVARERKFAPVHRPALAHFAAKMESSTDKSPQHIWNVFVVHGTREKSARVCLALGELLSQEGVWLVRTLVSLGDPQVTVYVHMNDRAYKIRSFITHLNSRPHSVACHS